MTSDELTEEEIFRQAEKRLAEKNLEEIERSRTCEYCGERVGWAWEFHNVVRHPETRPQPIWEKAPPKPKRKSGKKK